jgi:pyrroline-5-carboxylate reductase
MTPLPSPESPMLLFGCGNMGGAMLQGWLAAGMAPQSFVVSDPYAQNLPAGVAHHRDSQDLNQQFQTALIAIKPQMISELASEIERLLMPDALVISILAGTRIETLEAAFPGRTILRLMPNLAAALGKSPLGLVAQGDINTTEIEKLLQPLGTACWLASEEQMDAVTALAGSGPAFVYRFIEALAKAGEELGLDAEQALGLARSMVQGAADLAAGSTAAPEELARRVTSPGGTTAAGLAVLDESDALKKLIEATLTAARDRGVELSKA